MEQLQKIYSLVPYGITPKARKSILPLELANYDFCLNPRPRPPLL
jgi:hypothetical protein